MPSDGMTLYQDWLLDRGLSETPADKTAGVFLHELSPDNQTILIGEISDLDPEADKTLLKRLSAAINHPVSVIGVKGNDAIPWYVLIDSHPNLRQLILLGDGLEWSFQQSGANAKLFLSTEMIIRGPSPAMLATDVAAKRLLWQTIQQKSLN